MDAFGTAIVVTQQNYRRRIESIGMAKDSEISLGTDVRGENSLEVDGSRWWFGSAKPELGALGAAYSSFSQTEMVDREFTWYEFFAGGGMARLGLGAKWQCTFANEWCEKKASAYRASFGLSSELKVVDVAQLTLDDLLGSPDLG